MNREVFLSLLALDSYNRGYGQSVLTNSSDELSGVNQLGRTIGNATIIEQRIDSVAQMHYGDTLR